MSRFITDHVFEKTDFSTNRPQYEEYESCTFKACNFAGADLSALSFMDCRFVDCDLSLAKFHGTAVRETSFWGCKMLGLHFDACNKIGFGIEIKDCVADHSSFESMDLRQCQFSGTRFKEVDFVNANLSSVSFAECELTDADFSMANLSKADLSSAYNHTIDPEQTLVKGAKFSLSGLAGLLQKYGIKIVAG